MLHLSEGHNRLDDRIHHAQAVTAELASDIIGGTRLPSRIEHLIKSGAWTDAALALLELKLPQWQLRRLAYDEGEWHCALSRQRQLPDWLDQSIESHHAELPLAILSAVVDARGEAALLRKVSVPAVPLAVNPLCEPMCCDNFA
jgi:hypothetical protein